MQRYFLLCLMILLLPVGAARAHDSLGSNINIWVRPTGVDAEITMGRFAAASLIEKPGEKILIFEDTFPQYKDRLNAVAPSLLELRPGGPIGTALKLIRAASLYTDENDIRFMLHYDLAPPGPLYVHAAFIPKMAEGHIASTFINDRNGADLGYADLSSEKPDLVGHIPTPSPESSPPGSPLNDDDFYRNAGRITGIGIGVLIVGGILLHHFLKHPPAKGN